MKTISRIIALALVALMAMLCVGCNGGEGADTTPAATTPAATTPAATTPADTTVDSGLTEYKVTVVEDGGAPVEGVMVQICFGGLCTPAKTNADGVAVFKKAKDVYTVKFLGGVPAGYTCEAEEFAFGDATELTITLKKA
jgi:hypothetical protein